NATHHVPQFYDGTTGTAIKFTRSPIGLYSGDPVLHFPYTYKAGESIYYGIATHNGFAFWGENITLRAEAGKGAEDIVWGGKLERDYTVAYLRGELGLTFTLCE
ncbi:hypothetical protein GQ44DRAFT_605950, partial [Phaeosphaeriaceae sp. PMI808]